MPLKKPFLTLPTSYQELTLSVRDSRENLTRRCGAAENVREVLKTMRSLRLNLIDEIVG